MKKKILLTILLAPLAVIGLGALVPATGVRVDGDGVLVSPTNFWTANAAHLGGGATTDTNHIVIGADGLYMGLTGIYEWNAGDEVFNFYVGGDLLGQIYFGVGGVATILDVYGNPAATNADGSSSFTGTFNYIDGGDTFPSIQVRYADTYNASILNGKMVKLTNEHFGGIYTIAAGDGGIVIDGTTSGTFIGSGQFLDYLDADRIAFGTVPDARLNLTNLNASNLKSGTITNGRINAASIALTNSATSNSIVRFSNGTNIWSAITPEMVAPTNGLDFTFPVQLTINNRTNKWVNKPKVYQAIVDWEPSLSGTVYSVTEIENTTGATLSYYMTSTYDLHFTTTTPVFTTNKTAIYFTLGGNQGVHAMASVVNSTNVSIYSEGSETRHKMGVLINIGQ